MKMTQVVQQFGAINEKDEEGFQTDGSRKVNGVPQSFS